MSDPTRVTDQSALTTSTGRIWLIAGGILSAVTVALLLAMWQLEPRGAGVIGALVIVVIYLAMIVVRFSIAHDRTRLALLAVLTIAIPIGFFVVAGTITATEWAAVPGVR